MIINKKYILASTSKSRYHILKNAGFNFKQVNPLCDEEEIKKKIKNKLKKPALIAKKLSFEKARSISLKNKYFYDYIIGCDTLIYLNDKIYDKAKTLNEARMKIKRLSGKEHKIVSGLTICKEGKKIWQCETTTKIKVRKINSSAINQYLNKTGSQILQSVGCYQIESFGPLIIEDIKGDFFNVMGLPLFKLLKFIANQK